MFLRPKSLREAVEALATPGIQILAGGTDFYPALGDRHLSTPVLDVTGIGELSGIREEQDGVRIAAGTTWSELVATPLPRAFDALKAAAREVGSIQIQNRGTIAGNLCNASPAADGVPPLLALDAEVELMSRASTRRLPLAAFITGNRKTERRSDELVSAIRVPHSIDGPSVFLKLGARRYLVISIAMVAAILEDDGQGRIAQARIAVGACSAVARRLPELEAALLGLPMKPGIGSKVAVSHLAALSPIDDIRATAAYRRDAARTLVARALEQCAAG
ncbi:xanthine dehydrogenase [Hypericibacter adhaerens]|uniref:Xanthine dehydrogenase n=2 Tax=Hypericibacter adhaerens TaxID=2602016 RepID=A0A5J6N286_9PROT|nr:xanthine dehydrogenase family protein subunit M [Hypericibacter adhaerens]QEX23434.1 xanthine dehydrogenase [Hypericibacter adhaerens]